MIRKILLIEDDRLTSRFLKELLENEGYSIVTADDGERGIEEIKKNKPDMAIIDVILPGMDGYEVCGHIRKKYDSKELKIIIMTGNVDAIDAVKARKKGADDYCVKTSDYKPLMDAIKRIAR